MGLDLITIYIDKLRIKKSEDNITLEEAIFYNGFDGLSFTESINEYLFYRYFNTEGIEVRYFPYYNKGTLKIKFNIPKLMAGTNVASIYSFNFQQLFERLTFKVQPFIKLSEAPQLRFWGVSNVEINMDIILEIAKIHSIYRTLRKTTTSKYRMVKECDDGAGGRTLYFIPHNAYFETSNIVIKFYYKIPEMQINCLKFDINDIFNSDGIVNLKAVESILRLEVEIRRDKINDYFKNKNLMTVSGIITSQIGCFEHVSDLDFQFKFLEDCINEFNLNKAITTAKKLRDIIRSDKGLSSETKRAYWNVIKYENTEDSHKKKPSYKVKRSCLNFILSHGYNYLYADIDVGPISINEVIHKLPEVQRKEIALYKNSNIFKDMLYYKATPKRIYKGNIY